MKNKKDIISLFYLTTLGIFIFYLLGLLVNYRPDIKLFQSIYDIWLSFGTGVSFFVSFAVFFVALFLVLYVVFSIITRRKKKHLAKLADADSQSSSPVDLTNVPILRVSKLPGYVFPLLILLLVSGIAYIILTQHPAVQNYEVSAPTHSVHSTPDQGAGVSETNSHVQQPNDFLIIGAILVVVIVFIFIRQRRKPGYRTIHADQTEVWQQQYLEQIADLLELCYHKVQEISHPGDCINQVKTILTSKLKVIDPEHTQYLTSAELIREFFFRRLKLPASRTNELITLLEFEKPRFKDRTQKDCQLLSNLLMELEQVARSYLKLL